MHESNPGRTASGLLLALMLSATTATLSARSVPWRLFDSTGAAPERPVTELPAYEILRYNEDYAYLRDPAKRTDYLDPLKFIPLDSAGRIYLTFGGDMRQRYERYSGFGLGNGSVDSKEDGYYLARYLLHADLHVGETFCFFFQLKSNTESDRRGGARPNIDRDDFDLHQAFVDVRLPLPQIATDANLLVRLGRQELAYGDGRLIDFREGPNVRQSFDAAVISLQTPGVKTDAIYARQVATNKGVWDDGYDLQQAQLWGLYSTVGLPFLQRPRSGDKVSIDLFYLGYDRQNAAFDRSARVGSPVPLPGHETRHSVGGRLFGTVAPLGDGPLARSFHYNAAGVYQFGRYGGADISAFSFSTDAGYQFEQLLFKPDLTLIVDVISGDANGRDGKLETYNPLFPTAIFFSEAGLIGPNNVVSFHPSLDLSLHKALKLTTTVLGYWRQDTGDGVYNFGGAPSYPGTPGATLLAGKNLPTGPRYIGTEVNTRLTWSINRHVTFDVSYSHFFAGDYVRETAALTSNGGRTGRSFDYLATWLTYTF